MLFGLSYLDLNDRENPKVPAYIQMLNYLEQLLIVPMGVVILTFMYMNVFNFRLKQKKADPSVYNEIMSCITISYIKSSCINFPGK